MAWPGNGWLAPPIPPEKNNLLKILLKGRAEHADGRSVGFSIVAASTDRPETGSWVGRWRSICAGNAIPDLFRSGSESKTFMWPNMTNTSASAELSRNVLNKRACLIFVVDDVPLIGELIEVFLKMDGYPARIFDNPEVAWKAFEEALPKPKLLITDYSMQPFHGMELISRCLKILPNLKTILISGNVTENIAEQFSFKPDYFIQKPFRSRQLLAAVEALLTVGHYGDSDVV
jgi:CheY-like chemotaxis protein